MTVAIKKLKYSNVYSHAFGALCLTVVYLHSSWVGGFDIYNFGIQSVFLYKISSMVLMAIVPSFFILWGYLSNKYFYETENGFLFIKRKVMQYYPLYLIVFILHFIVFSSHKENLYHISEVIGVIGGVGGVYYKSGFYGGNIYLPVFFIVISVGILKYISIVETRNKILLHCIICLILSKIMPHESTVCYIKYFGYYTAFFLGCFLKELKFFDKILNNNFAFLLVIVFATFTPLLNYLGLKVLEIQYNPCSPEQLFFSVGILSILTKLLKTASGYKMFTKFFNFLSVIGNNAYFHFMIHGLVINSIIYISVFCSIPLILSQVIVIFFTSFITIYAIHPLYIRFKFF